MMSKQETRPAEVNKEVLDEEQLENVSGGEAQMPAGPRYTLPENRLADEPYAGMPGDGHWA